MLKKYLKDTKWARINLFKIPSFFELQMLLKFIKINLKKVYLSSISQLLEISFWPLFTYTQISFIQ